MKGSVIQYIVGILMLSFSFYQLYIKDYWEASLYITAGLAFLIMGLIKNNALPRYRSILNVLSWILILLAAFLFLFLVRTDG